MKHPGKNDHIYFSSGGTTAMAVAFDQMFF
jgi:hypothetical protein